MVRKSVSVINRFRGICYIFKLMTCSGIFQRESPIYFQISEIVRYYFNIDDLKLSKIAFVISNVRMILVDYILYFNIDQHFYSAILSVHVCLRQIKKKKWLKAPKQVQSYLLHLLTFFLTFAVFPGFKLVSIFRLILQFYVLKSKLFKRNFMTLLNACSFVLKCNSVCFGLFDLLFTCYRLFLFRMKKFQKLHNICCLFSY